MKTSAVHYINEYNCFAIRSNSQIKVLILHLSNKFLSFSELEEQFKQEYNYKQLDKIKQLFCELEYCI